jgi:hypothetical protein
MLVYKNGSPSSSDYNESDRERLADLTAIVGYLNDTLRPLLSALPDDALSPASAPVGVEGRTVYADTSDTGPLFFNPLTSLPLRVADSLRMLSGMLTTFQTQLTDMGVSVASLQSRLASTNQNDIALALRSLQDVANSLQVAQNTQQNPGPPLLPARPPASPSPPAPSGLHPLIPARRVRTRRLFSSPSPAVGGRDTGAS